MRTHVSPAQMCNPKRCIQLAVQSSYSVLRASSCCPFLHQLQGKHLFLPFFFKRWSVIRARLFYSQPAAAIRLPRISVASALSSHLYKIHRRGQVHRQLRQVHRTLPKQPKEPDETSQPESWETPASRRMLRSQVKAHIAASTLRYQTAATSTNGNGMDCIMRTLSPEVRMTSRRARA